MNPRNLTVLVIDDDIDATESLAQLLRHQGYQVAVSNDGINALSAVIEIAPDVLLLDLGMPRFSGFEVAKKIRSSSLPKQPWIMAVTGYDQPLHRLTAEMSGFDKFLVKPVDPQQILQLLREF